MRALSRKRRGTEPAPAVVTRLAEHEVVGAGLEQVGSLHRRPNHRKAIFGRRDGARPDLLPRDVRHDEQDDVDRAPLILKLDHRLEHQPQIVVIEVLGLEQLANLHQSLGSQQASTQDSELCVGVGPVLRGSARVRRRR